MRAAITLVALLAIGASARGCGGTAGTPAGRDACLGQACGAPCTPCAGGACPPTPAATACNGNQECAVPVPWDACYDPCHGLACGAECRVCPPGAAACGETAVLKACDAQGRCVPRVPGTCGP